MGGGDESIHINFLFDREMREVRQVEFEWGLWLHCPEQARTDYFFAGDLRERRSWVRIGRGGGG